MFEKKFGSTRLRTLEYKLELLKQKLKGSSARQKAFGKAFGARKEISVAKQNG